MGVPDEVFGQKVIAIIVLKEGFKFNKEQFMKILSSRLANYKLPRNVFVVASIPRNQLGKVNKKTILHDLNITI